MEKRGDRKGVGAINPRNLLRILALVFGLSALIAYDTIYYEIYTQGGVVLSFWWRWETTVEPFLLFGMTVVSVLALVVEIWRLR